MDDAIPDMRANRDFRAKFPDDVLHENLAGQLWFGAEVFFAFYYFLVHFYILLEYITLILKENASLSCNF